MSADAKVDAFPQDRKRQVLTFSYWAIKQVLDEAYLSALSELTGAQRSGTSVAPAAAKITALEDLAFIFSRYVDKEPSPHA